MCPDQSGRHRALLLQADVLPRLPLGRMEEKVPEERITLLGLPLRVLYVFRANIHVGLVP